uniref:Uncharacterized protein n=1 Tax=Oryza sativa subsp. japonica TaxID=39947 RepID=Q67TN6_ORYSJ|nr:hypothetical protein [Oryza sativa Japonica Group]BAD38485.1 hypothetical protein [Oryza sativa Japonica Group]
MHTHIYPLTPTCTHVRVRRTADDELRSWTTKEGPATRFGRGRRPASAVDDERPTTKFGRGRRPAEDVVRPRTSLFMDDDRPIKPFGRERRGGRRRWRGRRPAPVEGWSTAVEGPAAAVCAVEGLAAVEGPPAATRAVEEPVAVAETGGGGGAGSGGAGARWRGRRRRRQRARQWSATAEDVGLGGGRRRSAAAEDDVRRAKVAGGRCRRTAEACSGEKFQQPDGAKISRVPAWT